MLDPSAFATSAMRMALRARRTELLALDAQLDPLAQALRGAPAGRLVGQAQANARAARALVDRALVELANADDALFGCSGEAPR